MPSSSLSSKNQDGKTVHLICQRYRQCKILLDESQWRTVGNSNDDDDAPPHCGWLVYTSFVQGATLEAVQKAVLTLFQMPFGTWGLWQEKGASRPQSMGAMMQQAHNDDDKEAVGRVSVVLCPQANLTSQVKRNGKSVQYHGQCDKTLSEQFFAYFGLYLQALLVEQECQIRKELVPEELLAWKQETSLEAALAAAADDASWTQKLQIAVVVVGSFGKRQGLEFSSDMGPFCHTFQV